MHRLLYVSLANGAPDGPALADIVRVSLERNSVSGVTGFLYHDRQLYLQVLEGLRPDVEAIYGSIRRDPRHRAVATLALAPARRRIFGATPMGFFDAEAEGRSAAEVFGPGLHDRAPELDPAKILRFLRTLALDPRAARLTG